MTPSDTRIVRATISLLRREPGALTKSFDTHLQRRDAALHGVLSGLRFDAGATFAETLVAAIETAADPDQMMREVRSLGRRQGVYVWQPRRQAVIGQALIAALADTLGAAFTEDARQAWTNGYVVVAEAMLAATCNRLDLVA